MELRKVLQVFVKEEVYVKWVVEVSRQGSGMWHEPKRSCRSQIV
jgi:hypothetical protein